MNIFRYELRANGKTAFWYLVGMVAFLGFYLAFYPSFAKDSEAFLKVAEGFPPALESALGFRFADMVSLLGYYSFELLYVALVGSIWAMNLGVGILSKEERDKTADFLFSKPASRSVVILAKWGASLSLVVLSNLILFPLSAWFLGTISGESYPLRSFLLLTASVPFLEFFFLGVGFLIGAFLSRIRNTIGISLGVVFGTFAIGAFAVQGEDDLMRFLSPFKYFESRYILNNGTYEWEYLAFGLGVLVLCVLGAWVWYVRKDIESV